MDLYRIGCALVGAAAMMASGGALPFWSSLLAALLGAAAIYGGLWLVQNRISAGMRDYGYLAIGSMLVLIVVVVLPSLSGGFLMLGLISWAVITVLAGALLHFYRKTPLN